MRGNNPVSHLSPPIRPRAVRPFPLEQAVDTIMLSFCDDCDRHGGNPKFAPPQLQARKPGTRAGTSLCDACGGAGRLACAVTCSAFSVSTCAFLCRCSLGLCSWPQDAMGKVPEPAHVEQKV